jgi:type 1 glutamine amidotransferase/sugar phosphate isomerase/epimerase
VISRDPSLFAPESLRQFHAVFFNNTVGNLFEEPELRRSLVEFVYGGGGLMGVHGTSVAFTRWPGAIEDWPEFGIMLGARGANHRASEEHVFLKVEEPKHPVNQAFGGRDFDYRDEFFRVYEPYSRKRVRVLLSIDTGKTNLGEGPAYGKPLRADNDYALAWVRQYGRGRVFYCTFAHNPYVFWDATMLRFHLAAAQFALGDLPAPTIPSGRLTPALRAQEQLGWRLGLSAGRLPQSTLFEAVGQAAELGLLYVDGADQQTVGGVISKPFDPRLSSDDLRAIRLKLDEAGVSLLAYVVRQPPANEAGWRQIFQFSRKMGIETIVARALPETLDLLERLCDQFEINLALQADERGGPGSYVRPEELLALCRNRSPRVGACGNVAAWMRAGVAPSAAVQTLQGRLITLQMQDLNALTGTGREVAWGNGAGRLRECLGEIQRLALRPTMFGLDYQPASPGSGPAPAENIRFFNQASLALAPRDTP